MKNSKKLMTMSLSVLLAALSLGLTSCGGGDNPTTGGGENDPIFETDSIVDDVTKDAEGNVEFEEEVKIKVWSIIGDQTKLNSKLSLINSMKII